MAKMVIRGSWAIVAVLLVNNLPILPYLSSGVAGRENIFFF